MASWVWVLVGLFLSIYLKFSKAENELVLMIETRLKLGFSLFVRNLVYFQAVLYF